MFAGIVLFSLTWLASTMVAYWSRLTAEVLVFPVSSIRCAIYKRPISDASLFSIWRNLCQAPRLTAPYIRYRSFGSGPLPYRDLDFSLPVS